MKKSRQNLQAIRAARQEEAEDFYAAATPQWVAQLMGMMRTHKVDKLKVGDIVIEMTPGSYEPTIVHVHDGDGIADDAEKMERGQ